ncbi:MAG: endonuclease V [Candidatus Bathyarchaeia archaeon]
MKKKDEKIMKEGSEDKNTRGEWSGAKEILTVEERLLEKGAIGKERLEALRAIQREVASKALIIDGFKNPIHRIAAVDLAFFPKDDRCIVAALVFSITPKGLDVLETLQVQGELRFPYIPGFLAFREGPPILKALRMLSTDFDILLCNAHGIAHPLGCGCSTYVGVKIGKPTIGIAMKLLCGDYVKPIKLGQWMPVVYNSKIVGAAVLTKLGCLPIFVSPGHLVSLESSVKIVLGLIRGHKLPEPLWKAHKFANEAVRKHM